MNQSFAITVIGAGPAGLNACRHLLSAGVDRIALIDKAPPGSLPIACAEGVGSAGIARELELRAHWIRTPISTAVLHAPGGATLPYTQKGKGLIMDRRALQSELGTELLDLGVTGIFGAAATAVTRRPDSGFSVRLATGDIIDSTILIDASGPLGRLGGAAGLDTAQPDLEPSVCYTATNVSIEPQTIHVFVGSRVAPGGGYGWVFPSAAAQVTIGIVCPRHALNGSTIEQLLRELVSKHYPQARIERRFAGAIPCAGTASRVNAVPGYVRAGDSAAMVNPVSRAGIVEALAAGRLAACCAAAQLGSSTQKEQMRACKEYQKNWMSLYGKRHEKLARVKKSLEHVPDSDYDQGVKALFGEQRISLSKLFATAFLRFPRLAAAMRHLA